MLTTIKECYSLSAARCKISKLYKASGRTNTLSLSEAGEVIVITCDVFWKAQTNISDRKTSGMTSHPMLFDDLNTLLF
mgnify:CR=1 FL=1